MRPAALAGQAFPTTSAIVLQFFLLSSLLHLSVVLQFFSFTFHVTCC
jgi:hypothetical protein